MIFVLYTGTSALIICIICVSNIQRTQKYSAVMYKFFSVRKIVMLLWTRCGSWMVIVFCVCKGYHITVKKRVGKWWWHGSCWSPLLRWFRLPSDDVTPWEPLTLPVRWKIPAFALRHKARSSEHQYTVSPSVSMKNLNWCPEHVLCLRRRASTHSRSDSPYNLAWGITRSLIAFYVWWSIITIHLINTIHVMIMKKVMHILWCIGKRRVATDTCAWAETSDIALFLCMMTFIFMMIRSSNIIKMHT